MARGGLSLTVRIRDNSGALGGKGGRWSLDSRLKTLVKKVEEAATPAAQTAQNTSRSSIRRVRPLAPPRRGRYHGLAKAIEWNSRDGEVRLNTSKLDTEFPPWRVQEIGTGKRAVERSGKFDQRGRPSKTMIKTVKSQKGRRISSGLVWATKDGKYAPPRRGVGGQQLHLRRLVAKTDSETPVHNRNRAATGIVIEKEIEGQHFIQKGSTQGFQEYKKNVLAAARSQMRKKRR